MRIVWARWQQTRTLSKVHIFSATSSFNNFEHMLFYRIQCSPRRWAVFFNPCFLASSKRWGFCSYWAHSYSWAYTACKLLRRLVYVLRLNHSSHMVLHHVSCTILNTHRRLRPHLQIIPGLDPISITVPHVHSHVSWISDCDNYLDLNWGNSIENAARAKMCLRTRGMWGLVLYQGLYTCVRSICL